jgi:uncharacterized protein YegL
MARDRDILSDKEWFEKTTDIVEGVRDCKVTLTYINMQNQVQDKNWSSAGADHDKEFLLNVATPAVKGIEKFTALNHELGHILFETPMAEAKKIIRKWTEDENGKYLEVDGDFRHKTYWNMFNVLEDQRVESMMARLWLANDDRFDKAKKNRGKLHKNCPNNPIDKMLNIRFFREDLVKKDKHFKVFKDSLEDVVDTGRMGALVILAQIKPIIDSYFQTPDKPPKVPKGRINVGGSDKKTDDKIIDSITDVPDQHKPTPDDGSDSSKLSDSDNSQQASDNQVDAIANNELPDDYQNKIDDLKTDGDDTINDVKASMAGDGGDIDATPSYAMKIERSKEDYEINETISAGLKKVFRRMAEMPKTKIGYDGEEIDIETYIDNKTRGYDLTKCFLDKRYARGASIVISIDGSASMAGHSIDHVRNLVATLYDSVKEYTNIDMRANIWSSNNKGDVGITEINSLKDCKNISIYNQMHCAQTPTHLALDYSARQVKKMKGRKKLVIMLTDGLPNYSNNNYKMSRTQNMKMTQRSLLKLRRATPHIMVILVGGRWGAKEYMENIFGKRRLMTVSSIDLAADRVVSEFKALVAKSLQ